MGQGVHIPLPHLQIPRQPDVTLNFVSLPYMSGGRAIKCRIRDILLVQVLCVEECDALCRQRGDVVGPKVYHTPLAGSSHPNAPQECSTYLGSVGLGVVRISTHVSFVPIPIFVVEIQNKNIIMSTL